MRCLIGCEFSGIVRDALTKAGHYAMSCDLLPTERPGPHYQGDIRDCLDGGWDLLIAFPPCTYLTRAGARWFKGREAERADAINFVRLLLAAPIPRIAVENPPGAIGTQIRPADQYIQPWQFGHPEKKMTGLWLKGLPLLVPTKNVYDEMMKLPVKLQSRVHYCRPGPDRWKNRSRTLEGVAEAMAAQWNGGNS